MSPTRQCIWGDSLGSAAAAVVWVVFPDLWLCAGPSLSKDGVIDPVVHNKYKNKKKKQSINHNNIKCLYNQLNAHAHFVFTAQPSVLGKARACQCTLRRDNVSLYLALGVLAPRVQ